MPTAIIVALSAHATQGSAPRTANQSNDRKPSAATPNSTLRSRNVRSFASFHGPHGSSMRSLRRNRPASDGAYAISVRSPM